MNGQVKLYGWDDTNEKWIEVLVDTEGKVKVVAVIDELDDIGDVYVPSPTNLYILYWNNTNSRWECRAFTDWTHASAHQNGGDDEISVAGLSGLLADDQHVLDAEVLAVAAAVSHEDTHKSGGTDEIDEALGLAAMPTSIKTATITFIIDGGGSEITTGEKGHLEIPFACTINQVTMMADQSGSIVVDIWKDTYANFPPTDADSITAAAPPTISSAQKSQDSTLTDWTTSITAGDILAFNVDSCSTITRVTLSLKVTKT